jgi:NitT/TauT family transport system ATP-binding protein
MISIRGVHKEFALDGARVTALDPTDLDVRRGEFVSMIGPSGCGKSTLLRILAGLETASGGSIDVADGETRQRVGFVFQEPVLLPWLSALENVRFPLDTAGVARSEADDRAAGLLALVGLSGFAAALPRDLITRDRLNDELLSIWAQTRKTILFVTHSVEEAAYLSDRVVVMSPRPGRIKSIYDVSLARPRGEGTKLDPSFHRLMADLRRDLQ